MSFSFWSPGAAGFGLVVAASKEIVPEPISLCNTFFSCQVF